MAVLTKTIDGKQLPSEDFAYVGDAHDISTWHLPVDKDHIDSAVKMFGHETHVPASEKAKVAHKIAAKAKAAGIDTKDFESKYCSVEHGETPRPWIEIFRAGDYTKAGKGIITPADLHRVVRNYDPTYHEAPETLGHRSDDQPAYGWIDGLMLDGDTLLARERQVDPKFDEARRAGKFKKRSAAFYTDENGQVTGLRHLAWLGAGIPEVKGLQDVAFDDHGSKFITVDFGEDETVAEVTEKTIREQISAFFAELLGKKPGETATFSEADAKRIATEAATAAATPLQAKITELETKLTAQSAEFAEREKKIAGGETRQKSIDAVNKLKSAGRWIPAFDKMGLPLLFDELAKLTGTVEFGEAGADGKKPQVEPLQILVTFMEGVPKIVPGGRVVEAQTAQRGKTSTGDPLTDAAKARAKEKGIKFGEALAEISVEQPELTIAGSSAGGAV